VTMRWPNGGPPRLYVLVINATGEIQAFDRKQKRTAWLVRRHPRAYQVDKYTFLTYQQQGA